MARPEDRLPGSCPPALQRIVRGDQLLQRIWHIWHASRGRCPRGRGAALGLRHIRYLAQHGQLLPQRCELCYRLRTCTATLAGDPFIPVSLRANLPHGSGVHRFSRICVGKFNDRSFWLPNDS